MRRKARDILRGQQGLSMILVLCIGALFVALSAALVYAASVLTASFWSRRPTSWPRAFPTCWKGN